MIRGSGFLRPLGALLMAAALLCSARNATAGMGDERTLVVLGQVLAPDGTPVAGAHLSARGTTNTSALTDDRGHYSLSVTIGSAASLRRGAFTLEVRAENAGHRLAFGAGGSALGIEVALVPGGARVRVRSNSQGATSAIVSAFAQEGAATAWVEADFGGAARQGGAPVLRATDEVAVDGSSTSTPNPHAAAIAPRESAATIAPRHPRADSLPRENAAVIAPGHPRADSLSRENAAVIAPGHLRADSLPRASTPVTPARLAPAPIAPAPVAPAPMTPAPVVAVPMHVAAVAPASASSTLASKRGPARGDSSVPATATASRPLAAQAKRARAGRESVRAAHARASRAPRVAVTVAPAPLAATSPGNPPAVPPATRVLGTPERTETADTCTCRLRGTVEIDWERPLERDFPVELSLEGPAVQRGAVDMFIGSPREFRFGPLPCGEYRLVVRARGRLHYALERGDSVLAVSCHGLTQVRVVLVPARH